MASTSTAVSPAEFLSVRSASLLLDGIAENVIRDAIADEELPAARFGRSIRIDRADLLAWARSKKGGATD